LVRLAKIGLMEADNTAFQGRPDKVLERPEGQNTFNRLTENSGLAKPVIDEKTVNNSTGPAEK